MRGDYIFLSFGLNGSAIFFLVAKELVLVFEVHVVGCIFSVQLHCYLQFLLIAKWKAIGGLSFIGSGFLERKYCTCLS